MEGWRHLVKPTDLDRQNGRLDMLNQCKYIFLILINFLFLGHMVTLMFHPKLGSCNSAKQSQSAPQRHSESTKRAEIEHFLDFLLNVKDLVLPSTYRRRISHSGLSVDVRTFWTRRNHWPSLEVRTDLRLVLLWLIKNILRISEHISLADTQLPPHIHLQQEAPRR